MEPEDDWNTEALGDLRVVVVQRGQAQGAGDSSGGGSGGSGAAPPLREFFASKLQLARASPVFK